MKEIIHRCKRLGVKIVARGPLFTALYEDFNHDSHTIFQKQIEFIRKSGIITAMVGLLIQKGV